MAQIAFLGQELPIERNRLPLVLGVGAVALLLLSVFRRPVAASAPAGGSTSFDLAGAAEFRRVASEASLEMAQLSATSDYQRQLAQSAFANSPAGLRECWTPEEWKRLPKGVRQTIRSQASRSGSLLTAGNDGSFCLVPSAAGLSGDLQSVQRTSGGVFRSRSSGIGAPAPPPPKTGFASWLELQLKLLQVYAQSQGGGQG